MTATKAGDWNWNPQPNCLPPARKASSTATTAQNEATMPSV